MSRELCGRKPKLTPDQVRQLREWHRNRRTSKQMAAEMGISVSALNAWLRGDRKREVA